MSGKTTIWRSALAIAAVLLLALTAGCERETPRLNVLIIGVDTLCPDHLGCYGYGRGTSPEIDALASRGVLFENVISHSPWTLPSFATVFTSLYPTQHGASALNSQLRTDHPTLAMMLLKRGYSTAAIINAPFLRPEFKLDRGFEFYDYKPPFADRLADGTTTDALAWIDGHMGEPFFMFVHYFDPHLPYRPPPPYDTRFYPDYAGDLTASFDLNLFPRARATNFETMKSLTAEDWDYIRALYDGEIAFTDRAVGRLIAGLDERGLTDNTLIVFLSDHGEEFFEHQGFEHGHTLYDELIKVPLIVSLPGRVPERARVTEHARLVDIAPTILDFLGIDCADHLEGVSLKPMIDGGETCGGGRGLLPAGIGFSESMLYGTERKCVVAYPWKCIYDIVSGEHLLFNLNADPDENENLADTNPEALGAVRELLAKTVFGISETWYIELAGGGEEHVFDLKINSRAGPKTGSVYIARAFDSEGHMLEIASLGGSGFSSGGISVRGLKLSGKVTLAFKVEPERTPLKVDLRLDGEATADVIYLGTAMDSPSSVPFTIDRRKGESVPAGLPGERREGPYFLIWRSGKSLGEPTVFELGETIENELRSVGYLQ